MPAPQTLHEPHLRTSPIFTPPAASASHARDRCDGGPRDAESCPRGDTAKTYMAKTRCEGERALEAACYLEDLIEFDRRPRHGRTRSKGADHEQLPARHRQARQDLDLATQRTRQTRYRPPPRRQAALVTVHQAPLPLDAPLPGHCALFNLGATGESWFSKVSFP